ncbi:MAG: hypothetical protein NTX13_05195 [Acidobacteria bacterium]|nr:hypothetical protein [Acidobacteriota bacterium]
MSGPHPEVEIEPERVPSPLVRDALSNLGHEIARSTIAEILSRHGIEPAPEWSRKTTGKEFLSRHGELIVTTDFFTVEVWTRRGLQRFPVLFLIKLSTRKVEIAGIAPEASGLWMSRSRGVSPMRRREFLPGNAT